ncbi:alpha/beta-Hydrolases superfamily protein [Klebsormidium nitens]|uniref:Alpha/beta-Hydrolases superfamily protein n=1 Tax=Klebsormidium nitens TaxID=105231 RepID=A0A1Y1HGZ6_KLENI|nr:alpha/beta-Hydrolases superfamily protein [Klebsormidium nitens]|eukprot:GAQ77700.1 alpha/beta-Hydrolases superfamily protein [Klebsormidium nitens]
MMGATAGNSWGAAQTAFAVLSFFLFTTLDCFDWGLGWFYFCLDALLQADYDPHSPLETSLSRGGARRSSSDHSGGRARSHRHGSYSDGVVGTCTKEPLSVCVCKQLGESGRARRLRAIRDGRWHKCSCWGWQLDADRSYREHRNGLHAPTDGGVKSPQPTLPAEVDPLAGAPDAGDPSVMKAQKTNPVLHSPGETPDQSPAAQTPPVQDRPPAPSEFSFPVNLAGSSSDAKTADSLLHDGQVRHKYAATSGFPNNPDKSGGQTQKSRATRKGRGSTKRVYVGRWSDCQCPHCKEVRMQSHRTLFVRQIGRGVKRRADAGANLNATKESGPRTGIKAARGDQKLVDSHGGRNGVIRNGELKTTKVVAIDVRKKEGGFESQKLLPSPLGKRLSMNGGVSHILSPSLGNSESGGREKPDLIFLHGYCASSNFWLDTIFPHLPPALLAARRIFAPDLLGTGKSPRPHDCHYTLKDHVEALESSVLARHDVRAFHVIGHSMGSLMAVVLAARNVSRVRSVTLLAPVYADMAAPEIPPCEALMNIWAPGRVEKWGRLPRALWQRFLSSIPRWYLHFARFNSQVLYSRHSWLEAAARHVLPRSLPTSFISDFLRDTWDVQIHMFNNTLLGGGHALDSAYQVLADAGVRVLVDHGTSDVTCPIVGSEALARKYANVELRRCEGADHLEVVLGREREVMIGILEEVTLGEQRRRAEQVESAGRSPI